MNHLIRIQSRSQVALLSLVVAIGMMFSQSHAQDIESRVAQVKAQFAELRAAQSQMTEQYGEQHPKVLSIRQRLEKLQVEELALANQQAQLNQMQANEKALEQSLAAAKEKFGAKHPVVMALERQKKEVGAEYRRLKNKQKNNQERTGTQRNLQMLEEKYAHLQMMKQELSQRFGPGHPQSLAVTDQLDFMSRAIREQREISGKSVDQTYSRIASLAKQLKQEVSSLEPLKSNEKPLAQAMAELQKALVILKEVQELSQRSKDLVRMDEAHESEMQKAVMQDRVKEYENLIAAREDEMRAMQIQIEAITRQANATSEKNAMLAMAAAKKDTESKIATELEARSAQLVALEERLNLEMQKATEKLAAEELRIEAEKKSVEIEIAAKKRAVEKEIAVKKQAVEREIEAKKKVVEMEVAAQKQALKFAVEKQKAADADGAVSKRLDRVEQQMEEMTAILKKLVAAKSGEKKK
jgi:hypothetical protein